jgi:hypothetical protein
MSAIRDTMLSLVRETVWQTTYTNEYDPSWPLALYKPFDCYVTLLTGVVEKMVDAKAPSSVWDETGHPTGVLSNGFEDFPSLSHFSYLTVVVVFSPWLQQYDHHRFLPAIISNDWRVNYATLLKTARTLLLIFQNDVTFKAALERAEKELWEAFDQVLQIKSPETTRNDFFSEHPWKMPALTVKEQVSAALHESNQVSVDHGGTDDQLAVLLEKDGDRE